MFYDIFYKLCVLFKKKPSAVANELGINKSNITNWKNNGYTPRGDALKKIADYFAVPTEYLLEDGDHQERFLAWEKAILKFGFAWSYSFREDKKMQARSIIANPNATDDRKYEAQIIVFKALFSRSLEASGYSCDHVGFDDYVAMLLAQEQWSISIPPAVYKRLIKEFGKKEGISSGSYYSVSFSNTAPNNRHPAKDSQCELYHSCHEGKLHDTIERFLQLDEIDQAKIAERIDMLLEADKYSKKKSLRNA